MNKNREKPKKSKITTKGQLLNALASYGISATFHTPKLSDTLKKHEGRIKSNPSEISYTNEKGSKITYLFAGEDGDTLSQIRTVDPLKNIKIEHFDSEGYLTHTESQVSKKALNLIKESSELFIKQIQKEVLPENIIKYYRPGGFYTFNPSKPRCNKTVSLRI